MNTRRKGNTARHKCIVKFNQDGWATSIVERTGKFIMEKDCFGVGDVLAFKKAISKDTGKFATQVKIIQTTSNRPHSHKLYVDFANRFPGILLEQWVKMDRKGWKVYKYWEGCGKPEVVKLE
jgi:hypothetical protein